MPIYEYTCEKCNAKFDKLVKSMSSEEKIVCPTCGSGKTAKSLSVFAVKGETPVVSSGKAHNAGCACCSSAKACPAFQG